MPATKTEQQNGITTFRFMKAIPAGRACMACHGQSINHGLASKIQQLYPQDQATGYQPGDIRCAFRDGI
ncbi:MAG: c-type heme family protein [bacterium]